jgi:hypothetical protein
VSAAALAASAVFAVHPAAPSTATPSSAAAHFSYSLAAGEDATGAVVVSNLTDHPLTLALYGADLIPLSANGGYTVAQLGQQMHGVGAWIRVQPTVTLAPLTEDTVPFSVDVPETAAPGEYGGAVVAQNAPQGGAGIAVQTREALEVAVRVPGVTVLAAHLGPLRVDRSGSGVAFSAVLRNGGTERFRYSGRVLLQRGGSSLLLAAPMTPRAGYLLPGQEVRLDATWAHPPRFGSVSARASVVATPAAGPAETVTDAAVQLSFFPWLLVLLALLALLLLLIVSRRVWRYWPALSGSTRARAKPSYPLLPTVCTSVALTRRSDAISSLSSRVPRMAGSEESASTTAPLRTTLSTTMTLPGRVRRRAHRK